MTRYFPHRLGAPRIDRHRIPSGFAGTKLTAAHVARLIREGAGDFYVRQKAIDILLARGVAPKDYIGEIDALFRWVQRHVRYTKDPFHIEVLHASRRMLELRAGDCDDMTILLGALVKSVGHPVRLVLTGPNARRPDVFSHIYLEAQCQGDWIPLDATMPFAMGWSPRAPVRLVLSIEEESTHEQPTARTPAAARPPDRLVVPGSGARLAPRPDARDTPGRRAAARPTREDALGRAATATAPRAERVDQDDPASHLAEGTRPAAPPAHHAPDAGAAPGVGSAQGAATASLGWRPPEVGGDAASATAPSRDAASRGDSATDPGDAAAPTGPIASTAAIEKKGTLTSAVQGASALYRRYARLPARSLQRVSHQRLVPPVVVELGRLVAVVYRSEKWVGHPRTYIHYMEDPPRLASDVAGRRLFVIGGSYRVTARGIEG